MKTHGEYEELMNVKELANVGFSIIANYLMYPKLKAEASTADVAPLFVSTLLRFDLVGSQDTLTLFWFFFSRMAEMFKRSSCSDTGLNECMLSKRDWLSVIISTRP